METNRLKQFCVVNETKNLRKAAEILNMSHSALSKSLKVLQEEIGFVLLQQVGRGIIVTEVGKDFVSKALALLDLEKQILAKNNIFTEQFKIGSFESFSTHLLGMKWSKYFLDLPLQIHEFGSGQLEKAVYDGIIDAAITYEPVPMRDVEFISIGRVTMGTYHRKGFFKKMEFSQIPFVAPLIPSIGTPSSAKGLDGWPEHDYPRNIKYRVDLMESGLALVRSGQAAIFIPDFVAKSQNIAMGEDYKLVERSFSHLKKKIERRIFLIVKSTRQREQNIKMLVEMIKAECID
jgi:DNA-binding transcriptional LysR family regulator